MNELMRELLAWVEENPGVQFAVWENDVVARGVRAEDALRAAQWLYERESVNTEMSFWDGGTPFTPLTLTAQGVAELEDIRNPAPSPVGNVVNYLGNNNQTHTGVGDINPNDGRANGLRLAIIPAVIGAIAILISAVLTILFR
ncbi:hypothetical protein [Demequina lutea]|uniref:Uncharacterized protein n=1 Tax=Demequina lutea TaxID=431489 RepID=A0A7Y9ZBL3_9MICO|nr:hypothetical protein [Demequina lutea]NYI42397.1 hypothetical protein [Demequina lutea]